MTSAISRISTVQPGFETYSSRINRNPAPTGSIVNEQSGLEILQKATSSIETSSAAGAAATKVNLSAGHQQHMVAASYLAAQRALNNPDNFIGRNIAVAV